ncbi:hypothetical protein MMC28_003363 [Mycoblastus sanguinarius]|nr:hypothetical protein [Mycoblastus sanguinarius]
MSPKKEARNEFGLMHGSNKDVAKLVSLTEFLKSNQGPVAALPASSSTSAARSIETVNKNPTSDTTALSKHKHTVSSTSGKTTDSSALTKLKRTETATSSKSSDSYVLIENKLKQIDTSTSSKSTDSYVLISPKHTASIRSTETTSLTKHKETSSIMAKQSKKEAKAAKKEAKKAKKEAREELHLHANDENEASGLMGLAEFLDAVPEMPESTVQSPTRSTNSSGLISIAPGISIANLSFNPATAEAFDSLPEVAPESPRLYVSVAVEEESLDPNAPEPRHYTFEELINLILDHNIQLPIENDGFDGVTEPDAPEELEEPEEPGLRVSQEEIDNMNGDELDAAFEKFDAALRKEQEKAEKKSKKEKEGKKEGKKEAVKHVSPPKAPKSDKFNWAEDSKNLWEYMRTPTV